MTALVRKLIILSLGALAGICVWPVAESILFLQGGFPSYLLFLAVLGAVCGAFMGAFFGAGEGITSRIEARIPNGMLLGAAVGCVGGAVGLLAGQAALWVIGGLFLRSYVSFQRIVLPVSHAIGWAVLGMFVGAGEGIRATSPKKIGVGVLGGLVGGLAGGFVLEYSRLLFPHVIYSRLAGFVILGIAIGFFYGLIEQGLSRGILRVLTGELKGKEFLLNQNRMRIGRSRRVEIALPSYEDLADVQARIRIKDGEAYLVNLETDLPLLVNEKAVEERKLKLGDVIKLGSVKLFYKYS